MARFDYLLQKIRDAKFTDVPFRHIEIMDFLSEEDFHALITAPEIKLPPAKDDAAMFETFFRNNYKIINFPGCITDKEEYIAWHRQKGEVGARNNTACEGFGVTLRLVGPRDPMLLELIAFIESEAFNRTLADKFGIDFSAVYHDNGIQKYVDGYEISPHPDIRKKALTYMVNINPSANSEQQEHHTHYLKFKDAYRYVQEFWKGNPRVDRCWVPWNWCDTVKEQRANNSIVIFSPSNDTVHAVKAAYDHLLYQRTQLYGNLWYHVSDVDGTIDWEGLSLDASKFTQGKAKKSLGSYLPVGVKQAIKNVLYHEKQATFHSRDYYQNKKI